MNDELIINTIQYLRQHEELYGPVFFSDMPEINLSTNAEREINTLSDLKKAVQQCGGCGLIKYRSNLVFGEGNPNARLLILGGASKKEEDRVGRPFVGSQGELLTRILKAVGFERSEVFIANCIFCPMPEKFNLKDFYQGQCAVFLKKLIELIVPRLILALGDTAGRILSGRDVSLSDLRGKITERNGIGLMITYHPEMLLEKPELKRAVWEDMKLLRIYYDKTVGDKPKWQQQRR
jgi:uracil-DNA glycosylase